MLTKTNVNASIVTRNSTDLSEPTGNIYEAVAVIGRRAKQLQSQIKEELTGKLAEFASNVDNLEEIFENREQIEISRFYEKMPKPTTMATEEFLANELAYRYPEEEVDE